MTTVLAFVARHAGWFTVLALAGTVLMALGAVHAYRDWQRKAGSVLEEWAYVAFWRYVTAAVVFFVVALAVQFIARVAPDGRVVWTRLWNPGVGVSVEPTPTPIPVPNLIPTPTPTATPTPTPAPPTPTPTPTPTPILELSVGGYARVEADTLNVRAAAGLSADRVGVLRRGEVVAVVGGPKEADGYRWWQVRREDGLTGWAAEGTAEVTWLVPVPPPGE